MKTLNKFLWVLSVVIIGGSALADSAAPAQQSVIFGQSGWPLIATIVAVTVSWSTRKFSSWHFFHTTLGALAVSFVGCLAPLVVSLAQQGRLTLSGVELAAVTAWMSAMGMDGLAKPANSTIKTIVPGLLPFLLTGLLLGLSSGCATAGGQALAKCEMGLLPTASESVLTDVTAIAVAGGSNWQGELEQLAVSVGPSQLRCAVAAIVAAWSAKHAELSPVRAAALERLQIYLNAHPATACAPIIPLV
jgi:hypothetical protein